MHNRARSMSESIITIAFPVLSAIIYLKEGIFTNLKTSDEYVRGAGHSITVLTILLSITGIILWICVHAPNFVEEHFPKVMIFTSCLMILTSTAVYLLFKQNHKPLPIALAIILPLSCLGFIIKFFNKDQGGEVPIEELEHMLELAAGITNLLFFAFTGRAIDNFVATSSSSSPSLNSDFDCQLFFLFVGSLFGIFIMVLISVANQNSCSTKILTFHFLLVIAVMGNVLAGTWELLEGYAILEILPALVYFLIHLWKVFFKHEEQLPQRQNGDTKSVTLSFTNVAFAGLVAAIGFKDKNEKNCKFFAGFASVGLVCAVIWRLLTHGMINYPNINLIACILTLLLLFSAVVTSGFIVWG